MFVRIILAENIVPMNQVMPQLRGNEDLERTSVISHITILLLWS